MKEYFREVLNWENKVETKEIREGLVNWLRNRLMLKLDHSTRKRDETIKKMKRVPRMDQILAELLKAE